MADGERPGLRELVARGRSHYENGEYSEAATCFQEVLREKAPYADVYDMLGVIYHQEGRLAEAEQMFNEALRLNPAYTEAALNLVVTCNDLGKYAEAKAIYEKAMAASKQAPRELDPFAKGKIANMHAEISQAYQDAGMVPEAVQELERAVALCPGFADLRTKLATLYRDTNETARAREQLEAAREANPNYGQARLLLGVMHLTAGEYDAAIGEFDAVLSRDAENKSALMYRKLADAQRARSEHPGT